MSESFSLLLAGDALITRPWSQETDPGFLGLVETIRAADVAIANLETVIHDFKGYAQADSGGIHMHSPREIARELKWAGFDILAHANNHAFDYGSTAVLETLEHVESAGLVVAGSGKDLQEARAPRYFDCAGGRIALVAMASTFIPYGKASRSRPDLHGRPGLNPLTLLDVRWTLVVPRPVATLLRAVGRRIRRGFKDVDAAAFELGIQQLRVRFEAGRPRFFRGRRPLLGDQNANLDAIAEAARNADVVVASIHAHIQGRWLRSFAAEAIDRGAEVVLVHGPHQVHGIELLRGKPIFYSLGDFVYETAYIAKFPSESYDRAGLDDKAGPGELLAATRRSLDRGGAQRGTFEGTVATLLVCDGRIERIRLHPVDLQFDAGEARRGRPRLADAALGRKIIEAVAGQSKRFGTEVRYDAAKNVGEIECLQPAEAAQGAGEPGNRSRQP
jgi:poly-gamma-glutamate capsule biosynthesis protein CapA/YwtB (metallophosphatase superfamily)